jgi:menaquinone-dependent protoporphyrinogen oxidase
MNRRRFLGLIGGILGACGLTCAGSAILLASKKAPESVLPLSFPDTRSTENGAKRRILVAYASESGSTGGIAELIGTILTENSAAVDVRPVQTITDLTPYQAVVVGSAIHGGKWIPEASTFVETYQEQLQKIPTAFFLVGMMVANKSEGTKNLVNQFLAAERALVNPLVEGQFVGALYPEKYDSGAVLGLRFFLAYCGLGIRGGDYRDPEAVRSWANSLTGPLSLS